MDGFYFALGRGESGRDKCIGGIAATTGNNISSWRVRHLRGRAYPFLQQNFDEFIGRVIACCCLTCNGAKSMLGSVGRKC